MHEIVVNLHMHTRYSDGTGTHKDIAHAAIKVGVDAVIVTDHNVLVQGVEGYYRVARNRVLLLVGEEIHDQDRDPQKNHLLVFNGNRDLSHLADDPQTLINGVNEAGQGDQQALDVAQALLESQQNISLGDKDRLFGYLEGSGKIILPEPMALLTPASKMPGLDGQKMSKSYRNTISLREDPDDVSKKLRTMPTDPARGRRTDPGDPEKCPVWKLHQVYSDDKTKDWVQGGCRSAGIGCIECKQPVIDAVIAELKPIRERAREYINDPGAVKAIIDEGCEAARDVARDTLEEVRKAMGLVQR